MAALNQIQGGMYGTSLKPRLLRYLIKHKLPDEKHPFRDTSELVQLSDTVRTHKLLSETSSQPIDQKVMEEWKSAVDSWISLLVQLVSVDLVIFLVFRCVVFVSENVNIGLESREFYGSAPRNFVFRNLLCEFCCFDGSSVCFGNVNIGLKCQNFFC